MSTNTQTYSCGLHPNCVITDSGAHLGAMTPQPPNPQSQATESTLSVTFTIAELEAMLGNAKAGGSVEVVIKVTRELIM